MSFFKLNGTVRVMLAASAVLAASSHSARAETVFLKCGELTVYAVDLSNGTVDNLPAAINVTTISWVRNSSGSGITAQVYHYINRTTGVLTRWITYHWRGHTESSARRDLSCAVGGPPPRKF